MRVIKPFSQDKHPLLYLVGSPLGNLGDFSFRQREIIEEADLIACEDTRVTSDLLAKLNLPKKNLVSCYSQKEAEEGKKIVAQMKEKNLTAAFLSDAGMPGISDPGALLAKLCEDEGIPVSTVPGPTAFVSALVVSGFDTSDFSFFGFLPVKSSARKRKLTELKEREETLIFYEAPHRLKDVLSDMEEVFGNKREVSVSREMTKIHEEYWQGTLEEIVANLDDLTLKGEFVIVVKGAEKGEAVFSEETVVKEGRELLQQGYRKTEAAKILAKKYSLPKDNVYKLISTI